MIMKLMIRVLEYIAGLFFVFWGGVGGGTGSFVPQMGHIRTPSRNSVPHVGHFIMISSPFIYLLSYHTMCGRVNKAVMAENGILGGESFLVG